VIAAEAELGDAVDGGHENDGKEGTDVENQELFFEGPGEREEEKNGDGEEDVAADGIAGSVLGGGKVVGRWVDQRTSPVERVLTVRCI
jgi:hypothetical protein